MGLMHKLTLRSRTVRASSEVGATSSPIFSDSRYWSFVGSSRSPLYFEHSSTARLVAYHVHTLSLRLLFLPTVASPALQAWVSEVLEKATQLVQPTSTTNLTLNDRVLEFLSTNPTASYTTVGAAFVAFLFILYRYLMSYRSSFVPSYDGRGSPYASSLSNGNVSDMFEYVSADDYKTSRSGYGHRQPGAIEDDDAPDTIHIRHKTHAETMEFRPFAISEEKVLVHDVRKYCSNLFAADPRQIKLLYKGLELKNDNQSLKAYGLKQNSAVSVVISDADYDIVGHMSSSDDDRNRAVPENPRRRPRALSNVRHRSEENRIPLTSDFPPSNGYSSRDTRPPHRNSLHPDHADRDREPERRSTLHPEHAERGYDMRRTPSRTNQAPSTSPPLQFDTIPVNDPTSPLGKLQTISNTLTSTWVPQCQRFISNPPDDSATRGKEHLKLTESIMMQIVEKADTVEIMGDQTARGFRKELIGRANEVLKRLDVAKNGR